MPIKQKVFSCEQRGAKKHSNSPLIIHLSCRCMSFEGGERPRDSERWFVVMQPYSLFVFRHNQLSPVKRNRRYHRCLLSPPTHPTFAIPQYTVSNQQSILVRLCLLVLFPPFPPFSRTHPSACQFALRPPIYVDSNCYYYYIYSTYISPPKKLACGQSECNLPQLRITAKCRICCRKTRLAVGPQIENPTKLN